MHILLIEDDLDLGRALQSALQVEGHSSQWLRRASDAPLRLDETAHDAVLLDQNLPDGDGHELLTRWRRQGSKLPVIVITARSSLDARLAGFDGVADDGPGISIADREQALERFWRGKGHDQSGTGLGLAIVRQAAQRLGGQLKLTDGLAQRGLCVELQLPASVLGISWVSTSNNDRVNPDSHLEEELEDEDKDEGDRHRPGADSRIHDHGLGR